MSRKGIRNGKVKTHCSKCGEPLEKNRIGKQSYCKKCHNQYINDNRHLYFISPEQYKKIKVRAYTKLYMQRHEIVREPCFICGNPDTENHHEDYDKPKEIVWLCRKHHYEHHHLTPFDLSKGIIDLTKKSNLVRKRQPRGQRKATCCKCEKPPRPGGRYCNEHHAENMRAYRKRKKESKNG